MVHRVIHFLGWLIQLHSLYSSSFPAKFCKRGIVSWLWVLHPYSWFTPFRLSANIIQHPFHVVNSRINLPFEDGLYMFIYYISHQHFMAFFGHCFSGESHPRASTLPWSISPWAAPRRRSRCAGRSWSRFGARMMESSPPVSMEKPQENP